MNIAENIKSINHNLPVGVRLVAVSKTKPNEDILEAYNAGQKVFGENKVQDLVSKFEELPKDIEWHFIGHPQTNKVKYIAPFVSLIHGVDSKKLLKEINKQAGKFDRKIPVLLQMHIAEEDTKFGLNEDELNQIISSIQDFPNVEVAIFNRWGEQLFSSKGYTDPWDGKYNGTDLPGDDYWFKLIYQVLFGEEDGPRMGFITYFMEPKTAATLQRSKSQGGYEAFPLLFQFGYRAGLFLGVGRVYLNLF